MRRSSTAVVLVVVLVVAGVASVGLVGAQGSEEEPSSGETIEEPSVSLEELRDGGSNLPDAPPGIRADSERLWWLSHWPADAVLGDPGSFDDAYEERVSTGTTVSRTSVYLRTVAVDDRERTETVKVAYWRLDERKVEDGNVTRTEEIASDVVVEEHEVTYQAGMPIMEIPLRTAEEPRQVTMWIEGGPRWRFEHDPVATAEPIAVDSVGDFWGLAALYLVVPIVGGLGAGGVVGKKWIMRAGKGPGYPIGGWLVAITIGTGLLGMFFFDNIAELLEGAPYAVGGLVAVVGLVVILESQAVRERSVEFIKPRINSVGSPDGTEAVEVLDVERRSETVVDMPDGSPAIVRSGIRPFLARAFGVAATVPSLAFDTRIDVDGDDVDELIVVDPSSDSVLEYEPEGFAIDPPSTRDELVRVGSIGLVAAIAAAGIGMYLSWLVAIAGLVVLGSILLVAPTPGLADVEPAKAHVRSAWISSMLLSRDVEDARTLEEARETIISQQGRGERQVQEAIETQDATLVEEMLGTEVSRSHDETGPDVYSEELNDGGSEEEDDEDDGSLGEALEEALADD
jgi:hypothetical protein